MTAARSPRLKVCAAIIISGVSAGIVQIVALREILAGFYGTELLTGAVSAGWLAMNGVGCLLTSRFFSSASLKTLLRLQICLGLCGLCTCFGMLLGCSYLAANSHTQVNWLSYSVLALLALLPFCLLSGVQYAASVRVLTDTPGSGAASATAAYACDSVGMLIGFSAATFFLTMRLNTAESAIMVFGVSLLAAAVLALNRQELIREGLFLVLPGVILLSCAVASGIPDRLYQYAISSRVPAEKLEETADTEYARLVVTSFSGQYNFYLNGSLEGAHPANGEEAEKRVHFALLLHPDPKRIFVMGGLTSGVLDEVLKYQPTEVVYGDIDPGAISMALKYVGTSDTYSRVRFVATDVRTYLQKTDERFDVILLIPPAPATLAANRYYTREFFSFAERALDENGFIGTSIPSSETFIGDKMRRLDTSILLALLSVFDDTLIIPGDEGIVLAANGTERLQDAERTVLMRYRELKPDTKLISPEYIHYTLDPIRLKEAAVNLKYDGLCVANSDFFPSSMLYYSALVNDRESIPDFAELLSRQPPLRLFLILLSVLILPVLARFLGTYSFRTERRSQPAGHIAFLSGFSGFLCITSLSYLYQIKIGSLFGDIGILSAVSLCGYALGAAAAGRLKCAGKRTVITVFLGILALLAVILLSVMLPALLTHKVEFIVLMLLLGSLSGTVYPLLSRSVELSEKASIGPFLGVYTLELIGAALGAVMTGLILFGTIGLPYTVLLAISAVAMNLLLSLPRFGVNCQASSIK